MAKPLYIEVIEDIKTLKQLLKKAQPWARPRLLTHVTQQLNYSQNKLLTLPHERCNEFIYGLLVE